jgi:hypothetical protein
MPILEGVAGGDDQCGLLGVGTLSELVKRARADMGDEGRRSHSVREGSRHTERRSRVVGSVEGAQDITMLPSVCSCCGRPAGEHGNRAGGPRRKLPRDRAKRQGAGSPAHDQQLRSQLSGDRREDCRGISKPHRAGHGLGLRLRAAQHVAQALVAAL